MRDATPKNETGQHKQDAVILQSTKKQNVIGVAKNGINKLVEVVSPKQSTNYIINKMSNMLSNNPGAVGKIVTWVKGLFK